MAKTKLRSKTPKKKTPAPLASEKNDRDFISALFTLLYQKWIPEKHTNDALKQYKAGKSLPEIFEPYVANPDLVSRLWFLNSDQASLSTQNIKDTIYLLTGQDGNEEDVTYILNQLALGRKFDSLVIDIIEHENTQNRLETIRDRTNTQRDLIKVVHEIITGTSVSDGELENIITQSLGQNFETKLLNFIQTTKKK